jgi:hypothetical protein
MAAGQAIDLDAPANDPQWGKTTDFSPSDINWSGSAVGRYSGVQMVIVPNGSSGSECASNSGYADTDIPASKVKEGLLFCVFTTEKRFSLVKISKFTKAQQPITVDVTTYRGDDD